jgi:hypothetical protein
LSPGSLYPYEIKNGKIEIFACGTDWECPHKNGGKKEEAISFDILSSQQR